MMASLLSAILLVAGRLYAQDYTTLRPILDVLRQNHLSGSLQYRGCRDVDQYYVVPGFPIISRPPNTSGPPLQVLREMFARDTDMLVTQETDQTVSMVDNPVPKDLLNVTIKHLSFDDEQNKTREMGFPFAVLSFITSAPEVQAFMKDHDIGRQRKIIIESSPGEPHVTGELNNVTLAQALDYMAKSLHGLWVYKECPGDKKHKRIVDISFFRSGEQ